VDAAGLLIGLFDMLIGLLIVAVALPLARGKVEMNHWYGVRVRQSFQSEDQWYRINRYGGRQLMACGLIIAVVGAVAFFLELGSSPGLMALFLFAPLLVLVPAAASVLYARKA
jgi:uncharacterized membrane protein